MRIEQEIDPTDLRDSRCLPRIKSKEREVPRMALTKRQKQVLDFLAEFIAENHYSPSFEEIARNMDLASVATVHKHLQVLQEKGYIERRFNRSRALEMTPKYYDEIRANRRKLSFVRQETDTLRMPLVGAIAAGQPLETYEDTESLSFAQFLGTDNVFALQVHGQSMVEDHILDGDYVLIEKTKRARNGEIVVALVQGAETTLKRFFQEGTMVRLQPANMEMDPIIVPAGDVEVQGRLLAVHRRYR